MRSRRFLPCRLLPAAALLLSVALGAGCTNKNKARAVVKGKVLLNNAPLNAGTVNFFTSDNRTGSAEINEKGEYSMTDAPIGDVTITVTVPKIPQGGMAGVPKNPFGEMKPPDGSTPGKGMRPPGAMARDMSQIIPINDRYARADTSKLTFKVVKGEQTHDITLEP